jgi:hypothetical protein
MKCANHYEKDAVSQCIDCGKGLCPDCTNKFRIPLCDQCELKRIENGKQLLLKNGLIMIVLFIVGFSWNNQQGLFQRLVSGYYFAGIPWGWSILTSITPDMFLFLPIFGWVIYFFMKLLISVIIGAFVTPYKIYKIIKGMSDAKKLEEYTKGVSV